jgi:DNA-binding YbaB/EbfC family protein
MKEKLNDVTVEAEAGGGMVQVVATAGRQIKRIKLDPEVLKDAEMAEDLITSAVNKALEKADAASREALAEVTNSMLPGGIPGFDPSKLGL